jgi:hypothetical protein
LYDAEKQQLIDEHLDKIAKRREANDIIASFSSKILECDDPSVLEKNVIDSLEHATSALCNIEGIIEAARMYWEKMHDYYEKISTQKIGKIIKNNLGKDDEYKKNLYENRIFKRDAIIIYSRCIAVVS